MWLIKCAECPDVTRAPDIVALIGSHTDEAGWFICSQGHRGYIEKSFTTQEGPTWAPFLRGVVPLGEPGDTYQPFVFLVSSTATGEADQVWFSYYKDLRDSGGRLKLGYGPGGPPVLGVRAVVTLLRELVGLGCIDRSEAAI